jgi:SAM-dependent methyltransferase
LSVQPRTWHYGLVARWWAEFNSPDPDELAFYRRIIEGNGQPALDLACGAGRLLLPLLSAGLDIDGCDISPDMLVYCREGAARQRLTAMLYEQAMYELDLPRSYRTIYICDSFGIGGRRDQDAAALRRCYDHLDPGGTSVTLSPITTGSAGRTGSLSSVSVYPRRGQRPELERERPTGTRSSCARESSISTR